MIVCCPACHTRYRFDDPAPAAGARAVCSHCEEVVPLVQARREYVLRAHVSTVPDRVPVGVGPAVAAHDSGGGMPQPDRSSAPVAVPAHPMFGEHEVEPSPAPVARTASTETFGDVEPAAEGFENTFAEPHFAPPEPLGVAAESTVPPAEPAAVGEGSAQPTRRVARRTKPRSGGRRVVQLVTLLILAAAGAAGGEYATMQGWIPELTVHPAIQPVRIGLVGGLLGVLIAWIGIRWTSRRG